MITIISGTDRKNSNTLKIAQMAQRLLEGHGALTELMDLSQFPLHLFRPENYGCKSSEFASYQQKILNTDGILTVVPEYNGSYPGALKYFIDLLKFPESLYRKPCAFIGLAAGAFGGLRAVEHLAMVFNYREANLFGQRVFIPRVDKILSVDGTQLNDKFYSDLMSSMLANFIVFVEKLKSS